MRHPLRKLAGLTVGALTTSLLIAGPAFAGKAVAEGKPEAATATSLNLLWIILGATLVIFMQAGFALVETGLCRAKHAAHVVSTNWSCPGLTDTICKGRRTLEVSVNYAFIEEAGAAGEEASSAAVEAATS